MANGIVTPSAIATAAEDNTPAVMWKAFVCHHFTSNLLVYEIVINFHTDVTGKCNSS